jgi:hypothetical protein
LFARDRRVGTERVPLDPRLSDGEAAQVRKTALAVNSGLSAIEEIRQAKKDGKISHSDAVNHFSDRIGYADALATGQGQANGDQIRAAREKWARFVERNGLEAAETAFMNDAQNIKQQYARPQGVRNPKK